MVCLSLVMFHLLVQIASSLKFGVRQGARSTLRDNAPQGAPFMHDYLAQREDVTFLGSDQKCVCVLSISLQINSFSLIFARICAVVHHGDSKEAGATNQREGCITR